MQRKADVVALTALPVESQAIRDNLDHLHEEVHPVGTVYCVGTLFCGNSHLSVAVAETGLHNVPAAVEAERAINYFNPSTMLFVGIAGGIKDVNMGDVVAATKVYFYESEKIGLNTTLRPELYSSTYSMEQRARAEASKNDWLIRLKGQTLVPQPRVFVGPIASGGKILASKRSLVYQNLKKHYNDTLAIEMEGYGFLKVASDRRDIDALVVRGISDLLDNKNVQNENQHQKVAASRATAFALEVIAKMHFAKMYRNGEKCIINDNFRLHPKGRYATTDLQAIECGPDSEDNPKIHFQKSHETYNKKENLIEKALQQTFRFKDSFRILLIEDDPYDAYTIKHSLRLNGLDKNLIWARDGREAMLSLENQAEQKRLPDLILLDINLPDISGIDILTSIKRDEKLRNIPVVILTGSNVDEYIQTSYDFGAVSYLVKPISSDSLMLAIEMLESK